jgi:5'-methylthioadenosine phosphorylase
MKVHPRGTVVVIQGPRFSTAAESLWFTKMGWEVVNMTQYPEVALARELQICYAALAFPTDFDAGVVSLKKIPPVSAKEVVAVFRKNIDRAKNLMLAMLETWPSRGDCPCARSLEGARM